LQRSPQLNGAEAATPGFVTVNEPGVFLQTFFFKTILWKLFDDPTARSLNFGFFIKTLLLNTSAPVLNSVPMSSRLVLPSGSRSNLQLVIDATPGGVPLGGEVDELQVNVT
jgi:hypothetical protein